MEPEAGKGEEPIAYQVYGSWWAEPTSQPSFWCDRPFATDYVLGDGLQVCGITLDNVDVATQGSAIEELDDFNNYDFMGNELEIPESFPRSKDNGPG